MGVSEGNSLGRDSYNMSAKQGSDLGSESLYGWWRKEELILWEPVNGMV